MGVDQAKAKRETVPPQYKAEPYEESKKPGLDEILEPQNQSFNREWKVNTQPQNNEPESKKLEQSGKIKMSAGFNRASFEWVAPPEETSPNIQEDNPDQKI